MLYIFYGKANTPHNRRKRPDLHNDMSKSFKCIVIGGGDGTKTSVTSKHISMIGLLANTSL